MRRMLAALLVSSTCACVPLPSVSVRVRARVQHTQTRSAHALEARVDCGWSLEPRAQLQAASAVARERTADAEPAQGSLEPLACPEPSACSWAVRQRDAALATLVSP